MPNKCKELYDCHACCENLFINMTMSEFAVFVEGWRSVGLPIHYCPNAAFLYRRGDEMSEKMPGLLYACGVTLEHFKTTGKKGNSRVVAVFSGSCANLSPDGSGYCSIYPKRPPACHRFKFEGPECVALRSRVSNIALE